jgi:hypothetical protein
MTGDAESEKIDVYSYGIVLSELLTRQVPFRDQYNIKSFEDVIDAVLDDGAMPTIPEWCGSHMISLITRCLSRNPQERPSFMQIINHLRSFYQAPAERDGFRYFRTYDFPRILHMLLQEQRTIIVLAAAEIADSLPSSSESTSLISARKMLQIFSDKNVLHLLILRLSGLISTYCAKLFSKNESDEAASSVIQYALKALSKILIHCDKSERSSLKDILREEGGLRSLFALLTKDETFERSAKSVIAALIRGLELKDQMKMLEFSYQDLNNHDIHGLLSFSSIIGDEQVSLKHQIAELENLIEEKKALQKRIEITVKVLQTELKKRGADSSIVTAHPRKQNVHENIEIPIAILEAIPDEEDIPESFIEYYGDFKRIHCGYSAVGYVHNSQDPVQLSIKYLVLFGNVIRIYESRDSDPSDSLELVYATTSVGSPVSLELSGYDSKTPYLKIASGQSKNYVICCKTYEEVGRWAHIIDPNSHSPPGAEKSLEEPSHAKDNLEASGIDPYVQQQMDVGMDISIVLDQHHTPSDAFLEHFGEDSCLFCGYLAVKTSTDFPWRTAFCVLLRWKEIRFFDRASDEPDDSWGVVKMEEDKTEVLIPKAEFTSSKSWSARTFGLKSHHFGYLFCTRNQTDRDSWISALSPKSIQTLDISALTNLLSVPL